MTTTIKLQRKADQVQISIELNFQPGTSMMDYEEQILQALNEAGREQVVLDEVGGEITVTKRGRLWGKQRRTMRTNEVRRLELGYEVTGPVETFTVWAVVGPEEEKIPLASYSGYEGWADPEEWRGFTQELGRSLGVEARV